MPKIKKPTSYFDKLETDIRSKQSSMSLVLGALIILVVGLLIYNYFSNRNNPSLGPAEQTTTENDVSPENLPGKYTVKEGDTLFLIAEKYYQDGFQFTEIAKANNLTDVNAVVVGQVLDIPKIESTTASETATPSASIETSPNPIASASVMPSPSPTSAPVGEKGATNTWGTPITGDTYTVVEGDWLSTIASRAYGNILDYQKLAEANNISNPDLITPGMVLKLPK